MQIDYLYLFTFNICHMWSLIVVCHRSLVLQIATSCCTTYFYQRLVTRLRGLSCSVRERASLRNILHLQCFSDYACRGVYITDSILVDLGVRSSYAIGNDGLVVTLN